MSGGKRFYNRSDRAVCREARFRALSHPARYLLLRLLCAPETTSVPGLVPMHRGALADDVGMPSRELVAAFAELEAQRYARADWDAGLVWLVDGLRHNDPANPDAVLGWLAHWPLLPECALLDEAREHLREEIAHRGPAWAEKLSRVVGAPRDRVSPTVLTTVAPTVAPTVGPTVSPTVLGVPPTSGSGSGTGSGTQTAASPLTPAREVTNENQTTETATPTPPASASPTPISTPTNESTGQAQTTPETPDQADTESTKPKAASETSQPTKAAKGSSTASGELEVFDHWASRWNEVVQGTRSPNFSKERRAKVRARLAEGYAVDDLKLAVDGMFASPFHRGENPEGRRHLDLELACRNASKTDGFIAAAPKAPLAARPLAKTEPEGNAEPAEPIDFEARAEQTAEIFAMLDGAFGDPVAEFLNRPIVAPGAAS